MILKQRSDMVSSMCFLQTQASSTALDQMKVMDTETRKKRCVQLLHDKLNEFHCSFDGKMILDRANSVKLVVTGFGCLTNEVVHGQHTVKNAQRVGLSYFQVEGCL